VGLEIVDVIFPFASTYLLSSDCPILTFFWQLLYLNHSVRGLFVVRVNQIDFKARDAIYKSLMSQLVATNSSGGAGARLAQASASADAHSSKHDFTAKSAPFPLLDNRPTSGQRPNVPQKQANSPSPSQPIPTGTLIDVAADTSMSAALFVEMFCS
jgi:hypothetical protein